MFRPFKDPRYAQQSWAPRASPSPERRTSTRSYISSSMTERLHKHQLSVWTCVASLSFHSIAPKVPSTLSLYFPHAQRRHRNDQAPNLGSVTDLLRLQRPEYR